ncbi:hypothetical protein NOF04DRAFT_21492 [Fusarium oxysporum II5]|uniref:Methyltransferase n=2 Tax=Fusarium oxysporum species complex TaxID=171631 RepID=X0IN47_FUSO5|nr:methyltransferase [Fusarium odoratissimum NRRL 54006]EXL90308.1 methyltransferase [Fusarium odoratissimum NRRL 54006]KAK2132288.1 hypothetical protein NOF04DRAFT_21492 [Fusarium oxysporum II5]TXC07772.1 hypothetical protein FocTR4_00002414 [Fusarium oxysporum f. sp. cubense]
MAQIIYDATFFAKYPALDRSVKGLDGAPEWPRLRELPPSLSGNVIGFGCGFGWLARWAMDAAQILCEASITSKTCSPWRAKGPTITTSTMNSRISIA